MLQSVICGKHVISLRLQLDNIFTQLCTHIQLKQPNFAVFFSSYCNTERTSDSLIQQAPHAEGSLSVRESVKLAKGQNMLGLALDCRLLVRPTVLLAHSGHWLIIALCGLRRLFQLLYRASKTPGFC